MKNIINIFYIKYYKNNNTNCRYFIFFLIIDEKILV